MKNKETQKTRKDNSKTQARKQRNVAFYAKYQGKGIGVNQRRHLRRNRLKRLQIAIKDIGTTTERGKKIFARIDELKSLLATEVA